MTEQELASIFEKAKNGDRQAFALIYDEYSGRIYKFIYFRVGHKEVAEDVLSDTFVKAWQKLSQINSTKALLGWLYQVAKNNVIDYYRVRKTNVPLDEVLEIIEDSVNPVDETELSLNQKRILEALNQLSDEQQRVIKYKFFEDLTNKEIAALMNKKAGAIRVLQHRAINKLKELLNKKQ